VLGKSHATTAEIYITHFDSVILLTGAWAGGGEVVSSFVLLFIFVFCPLLALFIASTELERKWPSKIMILLDFNDDS